MGWPAIVSMILVVHHNAAVGVMLAECNDHPRRHSLVLPKLRAVQFAADLREFVADLSQVLLQQCCHLPWRAHGVLGIRVSFVADGVCEQQVAADQGLWRSRAPV